MKPISRLLLLAATVAAAACADLTAPTDGSGAVVLRLTIPDGGAGAVLVTIRGGPIDSITSADRELLWLETGDREYGLIVRGALADGATIELWVPDRAQAAAYAATVAQMVPAGTYQRAAP